MYDLTLSFEGNLNGKDPYCVFTPWNVFAKGIAPTRVHLHLHRIPVDAIPEEELAFQDWTRNLFYSKDQLLAKFEKERKLSEKSIVFKVKPDVFRLMFLWSFTFLLFYWVIWVIF